MIPVELLQRVHAGDQESTSGCLALAGPSKQASTDQTPSTPLTIEYTLVQLETAQTNLEVFAQHIREYIADHRSGQCACSHPLSLACPRIMSTSVGKIGALGIPVMETIVSLLQAIMEHTTTRCSACSPLTPARLAHVSLR